jgi:rhodanese-related sulfurtransferase
MEVIPEQGSEPVGRVLREIPPHSAYRMLCGSTGLKPTVLDVRGAPEFSTGCIAGAVNLDCYAEGFLGRLAALPRVRPYIVCCQDGGHSAWVLELMYYLGFREAYCITGGLARWAKDGLPVDSG